MTTVDDVITTGLISKHTTQDRQNSMVTKSCGCGHWLTRHLFTGPIRAQCLRHATVTKLLHLPLQTGVPGLAVCAVRRLSSLSWDSWCLSRHPGLLSYDRGVQEGDRFRSQGVSYRENSRKIKEQF